MMSVCPCDTGGRARNARLGDKVLVIERRSNDPMHVPVFGFVYLEARQLPCYDPAEDATEGCVSASRKCS